MDDGGTFNSAAVSATVKTSVVPDASRTGLRVIAGLGVLRCIVFSYDCQITRQYYPLTGLLHSSTISSV